MTHALLRFVLTAEIVLVSAALTAFVGHAIWYGAVQKRRRPQVLRGRALLAAAIEAPPDAGSLEQLADLPDSVKLSIFEEVAPRLEGSDRLRLMDVAADMGITQTAAKLCRKRAWWKRLRGVRIFTLVGGGEDVVPDLLDDKAPDVRAQAAEWGAWHPHQEMIEHLIRMLDDDRSLSRFTVQDSLYRLGSRVVDPLADALRRGDVSSVEAGLSVAARISDARFLEVALQLSDDGREGVRMRAAEVLGSIGGAGAASRLLELLEDREASVRVAAARGLGKLGQWMAAPRLGSLLRDASWDVRKQAATSLVDFGAPGVLILRRAIKAEDPFTRDMAQHVMDVRRGGPRAS